jgi:hypothetical protein
MIRGRSDEWRDAAVHPRTSADIRMNPRSKLFPTDAPEPAWNSEELPRISADEADGRGSTPKNIRAQKHSRVFARFCGFVPLFVPSRFAPNQVGTHWDDNAQKRAKTRKNNGQSNKNKGRERRPKPLTRTALSRMVARVPPFHRSTLAFHRPAPPFTRSATV